MGYTNYWIFQNENCQKEYTEAKKEIVDFVKWAKKNKGYNLKFKAYKTGEIIFNGKGADEYEDFFLSSSIDLSDAFNCCKTNRNNYDGIVLASIFILKKYLKENVMISSDGFSHKSIQPNYDEYCDIEIKEGYILFVEFQKTLQGEYAPKGILSMFQK